VIHGRPVRASPKVLVWQELFFRSFSPSSAELAVKGAIGDNASANVENICIENIYLPTYVLKFYQ
jgi:hypothetical protein